MQKSKVVRYVLKRVNDEIIIDIVIPLFSRLPGTTGMELCNPVEEHSRLTLVQFREDIPVIFFFSSLSLSWLTGDSSVHTAPDIKASSPSPLTLTILINQSVNATSFICTLTSSLNGSLAATLPGCRNDRSRRL